LMIHVKKLILIFLLLSQTCVTLAESTYTYYDIDPNDLTPWLESEYPGWEPGHIWASEGPYRPGDQVLVEVTPRYLTKATPHFKLIRVDEGPQVIQEYTGDNQSTTWTITLPDAFPAKYRLGLALELRDSTSFFVRNITVDEGRVELILDKTEYRHDEEPKMTVKNLCTFPLSFGVDYWFEKYYDMEWRRVIWNPTWIAILIELPPGEVYNKKLSHPTFSEGLYRVCKTVEVRNSTRLVGQGPIYRETLKAEFSVTSSPGVFYYLKLASPGKIGLLFLALFLPFLGLFFYRLRSIHFFKDRL